MSRGKRRGTPVVQLTSQHPDISGTLQCINCKTKKDSTDKLVEHVNRRENCRLAYEEHGAKRRRKEQAREKERLERARERETGLHEEGEVPVERHSNEMSRTQERDEEEMRREEGHSSEEEHGRSELGDAGRVSGTLDAAPAQVSSAEGSASLLPLLSKTKERHSVGCRVLLPESVTLLVPMPPLPVAWRLVLPFSSPLQSTVKARPLPLLLYQP